MQQYLDKLSGLEQKVHELESTCEQVVSERSTLQELKTKILVENQRFQSENARLAGAVEENKSLKQQFEYMSKKLENLQKENSQFKLEIEQNRQVLMSYEGKFKGYQSTLDQENRLKQNQIMQLTEELEQQKQAQAELLGA